MTKAIFIDRDGTINNDEGHYYICRNEDFKLNNGVVESLKILQNKDYIIIVISNQSGVAKNIYTKQDVEEVNNFMLSQFKERDINIEEIYYCPHHPQQSKCLCRKPNSLMLEKAIARYNIDIKKSYFIGDSERDVEAGKNAGLNTIKINKNDDLRNYLNKIK